MGLLGKKSNEYDNAGIGHTGTGVGHTSNPYTTGNPTLTSNQGTYEHNQGSLGHHTGQGISGTGTTAGGNINTHQPPIVGTGQVNTGPAPLHNGHNGITPNSKEAIKLEKKGQREEKLGNLLHSTSMQQKGATHLSEANHLKMQASELNEAERLEHEAGLRRQRAVGLGADPMHAHGQTGHGPHHI
ncbi:uncharacterized protein I206_105669 [Kwoniella pini CBS 10737]|uniref:Uncharacterized protein n=1 Tax=Kwoniella pini CBS 10737 TaxID=1296096 RepID=A0A1B9I3K7_9TREE|nr:uncharacterized protein I206_03429 [Kwoniella pini CBS 10737]OCF50112.1 hypothetical protein I206_03429 [Kwoniella pini CBS 10737]